MGLFKTLATIAAGAAAVVAAPVVIVGGGIAAAAGAVGAAAAGAAGAIGATAAGVASTVGAAAAGAASTVGAAAAGAASTVGAAAAGAASTVGAAAASAGTAAVGVATSKVGIAAGGVIASYLTHGAGEEEGRKKGRKEGFKQGEEHGFNEAKKQLVEILKNNDNLKCATMALGVCVAYADYCVAPEEIAEIESVIGRSDSYVHNDCVKDKLEKILKEKPSFTEVKTKYLVNVSVENLKLMDMVVRDIINADDKVTPQEKNFYNDSWRPYLRSRGIYVRELSN